MTKRRDELAGLKARFAALSGTVGPCDWCGTTDLKRKRTPGGLYCLNAVACNKRRKIRDLTPEHKESAAKVADWLARVARERTATAAPYAAPYAPTPFTGRDCPACHWNERAPVESLCRVCRAPMLTPSPETLARIEEERDSIAHLPRNLGGGGRKRGEPPKVAPTRCVYCRGWIRKGGIAQNYGDGEPEQYAHAKCEREARR